MWSVGCVFAEMIKGDLLFDAYSEAALQVEIFSKFAILESLTTNKVVENPDTIRYFVIAQDQELLLKRSHANSADSKNYCYHSIARREFRRFREVIFSNIDSHYKFEL